MALSSLRSVGKLIPSIAGRSSAFATNFKVKNGIRFASAISSSSQRSLWHLANRTNQTRLCGCSHLHTQGDKELADFLADEIQTENENTEHHAGEIKDFKVETMQGAEVTLVKEASGETIRVRTNVNNSMDDDSEGAADQEVDPQMVCRPPFTVELTKEGVGMTLHINCEFPHPHDMVQDPETVDNQFVDVIEIREVALTEAGKEWESNTFSVAGSVMDGEFYDRLISMLEERGIDGDFCDQFVTLVTSYEHKNYIGFLQDIQKFVKSN